jgi:hypothetical protein
MTREVLHQVCHGAYPPSPIQLASLTVQNAILHDHCRHRVRHCDYPGTVPDAGQSVRGTYVTGLTDADLWRLDQFEGSQYERRRVKVRLLNERGEETEEKNTETYIWIAPEEELEKGEWSFDTFVKEKLSRWVSSGEEYAGK